MLKETSDSHKFSWLDAVVEEELGVKCPELVGEVGMEAVTVIWDAFMCISN